MEGHLIAALVVGVLVVVVTVLWTRFDAFIGLLFGAIATGLIAGISAMDLLDVMSSGFGETMASIGLVIVLGVFIGKLLEETGAADQMALFFLRLTGRGREDVALTLTGAAVSIPVFADSGYVILSPLARSIARNSARVFPVLSIALAGGLAITHHLVPPTPGPLAAAGFYGADLGLTIVVSLLFAIPLIPLVIIYSRVVGGRVAREMEPTTFMASEPALLQTNSDSAETATRDVSLSSQPGGVQGEEAAAYEGNSAESKRVFWPVFRSSIPLLVPLGLIVGNTVAEAVAPGSPTSNVFAVIGSPWIALLIGLVIAVYLLPSRKTGRSVIAGWLTEAAGDAGKIVFIIGAGGAFAGVLDESGVGSALAEEVASWAIPTLLMPYLVSAFMRIAQGSATVGIITAATLTAPLVAGGALDPVVAVLSACAGSFLFSHVNDSFFWVIARFTGLTAAQQMKIWPGMTVVLGLGSLPLLWITDLIMG